MTNRLLGSAAVAALLVAGGCSDATPTSDDAGLIPLQPRTIEFLLSFDEFADSLQRLEGYSTQALLPGGTVADDWRGDLDVRTLVRFGKPADRIFVVPPGSQQQTTVPDVNFRPIAGRVTVYLDSIEIAGQPPFLFEASAIDAPWHPPSTSWTLAIDTLGNVAPWPQPGGGPVTPIGVESWSGFSEGDSIVFAVDSLTVSRWFDANRNDNGLRLAVSNAGSRVRIVDAGLVYIVRSSVHPDTIVETASLSRQMTVIYDPEPPPLADGFRIGGAPAYRAAFHFGLPASLVGNAQTCAAVPCPIGLLPERLVYAGLQLHSRYTDPRGLQPLDTIAIDMRPVLAPERVPRSPLGVTVQGFPTFLDPGVFSLGSDTLVEFPMTRYVRDLLRDPTGQEVSHVLAFLTGFEPWSLEHATFWGPGSDLEPRLRLVFTLTDGIALP